MIKLSELLEAFPFLKHPEGGYFLETYRSDKKFEDRSASTGIYFLLEKGDFSAFHRIKSDEMWHFYAGEALEIVEIDLEGQLIKTILGPNVLSGETFQYVVKAGHWFGARPQMGSAYNLAGCTVSPGFDYRDWELAKKDELTKAYPRHKEIIAELSR